MPPGDMPQPDATKPASGSFKDQWYGAWNPSDSSDDPHDLPYKEGEGGTIGAGPVPENIVVGAPGPFSSVNPHFKDPGVMSDPHTTD